MPTKAFRNTDHSFRAPTAKAGPQSIVDGAWAWMVLNVLRLPAADTVWPPWNNVVSNLAVFNSKAPAPDSDRHGHVSDHAASTWKKKMAVRVAAGLVMAVGLTLVVQAGHLAVCSLVVAIQCAIFYELVALRFTAAKQKSVEGPMFRTVQWGWFATAMLHSYGSSWLKAPLGGQQYLAKLHAWSLGVGVAPNTSGIVDVDAAASFSSNGQLQHAAVYSTNASPHAVVEAVAVGLYSVMLVVTVLSLTPGLYPQQISQLSWTGLILLAVVFQLKATVYSIYTGLYFLIFPASLVVANDTFAYFCGMSFGKKLVKRPFMALSPSKTWEGFLGAFFLTMAYAYWTANYWGSSRTMRCSFPELADGAAACASDKYFAAADDGSMSRAQAVGLALALFASLIAPFGGFFASAVKRATSVKDFAGYIPGHGGFTDRMDCQLIMAVAAWAVYALCMPHAAAQVGNFKYVVEHDLYVNGSV